MSASMPLSDFNRNPSRATRLARIGSVTITDHGLPAFELRAVARPSLRSEALIRAGILAPPQVFSAEPLPDFGVDPAVARAAVAGYEREKAARDY